MRDRLLGRSLCCASISATVFFEKALDFLLVGFHDANLPADPLQRFQMRAKEEK